MNIVFNPGDYFECGQNETYSKIIIISNTHCIIKRGLYIGETMPIDEWLTINEENKTTIKKTSRHDAIDDPDTILRTDSINSNASTVNLDKKVKTRTHVSTDLYCDSEEDIKLEELQIKPKLRRATAVIVGTPNLVIEQTDQTDETYETQKTQKTEKKKPYPWYYYLFICF